MRKLLIIDGHNFLWKAYGVPFKFHSRKGTPLHVVTAFMSLMRRAVKAADASGNCGVVIVFDRPEETDNHRLSENYKANRKKDYSEDEDSPFHHLPQVVRVLKHLKVRTFSKKGAEADDLIASLARQFLAEFRSGHVFIASSDSDFYQLLGRNVSQVLLGPKGTHDILRPSSVKARTGVLPRQYVYFKSLTGDKADNVKGLPGVGPLRALRIIKKELAMDLRPHLSQIELNRKLIGLNGTLTVCRKPAALVPNPRIFAAKNADIFQKIGF
jgi:DNA polymerase I